MLSSRPVRGRRLYRVILVAAPVLALVIAQACAAPTQARVRIRSTLTCDQLNGVNIVVGPSSEVAETRVGERAVNTTARDCVPDPAGTLVDLGTVVLAPGEERGAIVVVAGTKNLPGVAARAADLCGVRIASGPGDYKDCIVARRRFSYVDNKTLEFTITLDNACINQPCDAATETCSAGKCVSAELSCQSDTCVVTNEGQGAAAAPLDAAVPATDVALPPGTDAAVVDASLGDAAVADGAEVDGTVIPAPEPEPLSPCEPRCASPATPSGSSTCLPGQECCVVSSGPQTNSTCVPTGASCGAGSLAKYVRLCCTGPCSSTQRCVASRPPSPGGTLVLQTQCLRPTDPNPTGFDGVVCTGPNDCAQMQECLPVTSSGVALKLCVPR